MARIDDIIGVVASAAFTGMTFGLPLGSMMIGALFQSEPAVQAIEIPVAQWVTMDLMMNVMTEDQGMADADLAEEAALSDVIEVTGPEGEDLELAEGDAETTADEPPPEPLVADLETREVPKSREEVIAARASTSPKKAKKTRDCGGPHEDIAKVDDDKWTIERSLVRYYTSTIPRFNSLGWSRAHDEDGQKGWYISGFSCKSPLYKGGLRPRDVVQSVNGKPTNTMLQIFGAYTRMGTTKNFEVKVLRRGKVVTLNYTLT